MVSWVTVGETQYGVERLSTADVHCKSPNTTKPLDFGVFIDKGIRAERGPVPWSGPLSSLNAKYIWLTPEPSSGMLRAEGGGCEEDQ